MKICEYEDVYTPIKAEILKRENVFPFQVHLCLLEDFEGLNAEYKKGDVITLPSHDLCERAS